LVQPGNSHATANRRAYFAELLPLLSVPGADIALDDGTTDLELWRSAGVRVIYPGHYLSDLGILRPFVLLEIGSARISPFVERDCSSFVHNYLSVSGQLEAYVDNRPKAVRCVHPVVTLIEKLDAIQRRFPNDDIEAVKFVRHYEDVGSIIAKEAELPALDDGQTPNALLQEMLAGRQIRVLPSSSNAAFSPDTRPRWNEIRAAHASIGPMFWGERLELDEACASIRGWISRNAS
jgi:hypothetical protein